MTSTETTTAESQPLSPEKKLEKAFENLTEINLMLHRMDRRDRLRTIGGFFRSIVMLIPAIALVLSAWYAYYNLDKILSKVSDEAAKSALRYSQGGSNELFKSIKGLVKP